MYPPLNHFQRAYTTQCELIYLSLHLFLVTYIIRVALLIKITFCRLTSTIFNTTHDFPWSGFKQNDKGLLFDMEFNQTDTSKHNLQYEAAFRNISCSKQAAFHVREQCGPNLKSALRYIWTIDKRDCPLFPVTGSFLRLTTEMAGLGGDIGFLRNELAMQTNWSPHEYLVSTFYLL